MILERLYEYVGGLVGTHPDHLRYLTLITAVYPMSSVYYRHVHWNPKFSILIKRLIHIVIGNLMLLYCFHYSSLLHVYSLIFAVFFMVKMSLKPSYTMFFTILFLSLRLYFY